MEIDFLSVHTGWIFLLKAKKWQIFKSQEKRKLFLIAILGIQYMEFCWCTYCPIFFIFIFAWIKLIFTRLLKLILFSITVSFLTLYTGLANSFFSKFLKNHAFCVKAFCWKLPIKIFVSWNKQSRFFFDTMRPELVCLDHFFGDKAF